MAAKSKSVSTDDTSKATEKNQASLDNDESNDFLALNNKNAKEFLQEFVLECQRVLSSFLRKKISISLDSVTPFVPDQYQADGKKELVLSFQTQPRIHYGIIFFDFLFLHIVITVLFGGELDPNEPVMNRSGKLGMKIATKLAELCLQAMEKIIKDYLKIEMTLTNLNPQLYHFVNQDKLISFLCFNLGIHYESTTTQLNIVVPGHLFDAKIEELSVPVEINEEESPDDSLERLFESQLQDSMVEISVSLPDIKLRVNDALDLKTGDIIPIGDPSSVMIYLGSKKIFKGQAGQIKQKRVVKITDKI